MKKKIAILGSGQAGHALAKGFDKYGYDVILANRQAKSVEGWSGRVGKINDAAQEGEIVVLAVKGTAAEEVVKNIKNQIAGKTVIDVTNPIAQVPPENGVLKYFLPV